MNKLLRFVSLAAALGLTSWLATAKPVFAYPPCAVIDGSSCVGGGQTYCSPDGLCVCFNRHWDCGQ